MSVITDDKLASDDPRRGTNIGANGANNSAPAHDEGYYAREWEQPNQGAVRNVWMTLSMTLMMFCTAVGCYLWFTDQVWGPMVDVFGRDVQLHWTAILIIVAMISLVQGIKTNSGGTLSIVAVTGLMVVSVLATIVLTEYTDNMKIVPSASSVVTTSIYYTVVALTVLVVAAMARVFLSWLMTNRPWSKIKSNTHLVANDDKIRSLKVAGRKTAAGISTVKPVFEPVRFVAVGIKWIMYFLTQPFLMFLQLGPWNFCSSTETRKERKAANRSKAPLGQRLLTGKKNTRKGLAIDLTPGLVALVTILLLRPVMFRQSLQATPSMVLTYGIWIYAAVSLVVFVHCFRKYPAARPFFGR